MARSQIAKQLANERRKIQRRITSLQKTRKVASSADVKETLTEEIRTLQKAKRASMLKTKTGRTIKSHNSEEYKQAALRTLQELNDKFGSYVRSMKAQNAITQTELNLASVGKKSSYSKNEVKAFYHATEHIWNAKDQNGVPVVSEHARNEAIMKAYGVRSLDEAVNIALTETKLQTKIASGEVTEDEVERAKNIIRHKSQHSKDEIDEAWDILDVNDVSEGIVSPADGESGVDMSGITPVGMR